MRYVVFEGLPAAGKSEVLELLARFYPERLRVFPEIVKEVATREGIDLFAERNRLTQAILAALPRRREEIEEALALGELCLEESHLGVHFAYSIALGDPTFVDAYATAEDALPHPDLYLRLEIPVKLSLVRQRARGTPQFEVGREALDRMSAHLAAWHLERKTPFLSLDADRPAAELLADVERILGLDYRKAQTASAGLFDVLLLLGRPASGKSEFIDFMKKCPHERRAARYHVGRFEVVDDFVTLWGKFEEDDLWECVGRPRLYSRRAGGNYVVADDRIWPFLVGRINQRAEAVLSGTGGCPPETLLVEFSRGGRSGYADALRGLSPRLLARAAILFVSVTFEESLRRNLARYDAARSGGILTHSVPREEMERTYTTDDWPCLASQSHGVLELGGVRVPYVTMENEPELFDPILLDRRYRRALDSLSTLWQESRG